MKAYTVFLPQFDEVRDHRTYSDTLKTVDSKDTCTDDRNVRFAAINKELIMKSDSKKTMGQMGKGSFFVVMLTALCFLLTLTGCSNIVENPGTGKPNPPEDGSGLVAVTGEVCLSGAFPGALQSGSNHQRTAIPTVGTVTYTVMAQNKADPEEKVTAQVQDDYSYTLYLSLGSWIISCSGVNDSGGQIIREKTPIELTVTQGESIPVPGTLELFLIQTPGEGGSGAVSLNGAIDFVKDSSATVAVDITLTPWESSVTVPDIPRQTITGNGNFTVTLDAVPSGAYMMTLVFSVDGVAVSTVEEAVNVFDNMTTDTWYLGGGTSDHLILEGDGSVSFNLTRCRTEFFIDGTGGEDTNPGSALKPLKTVGKVFSVLGKIKGADTAKITLQSDAGDTAGVTVPEGVDAVIFGEQAASVPVQITVGEGAAVKVGTNVTCSGGAMVQNGGVLTLTQGGTIDGAALFSGLKDGNGGAVYVDGGTFTMESGSTVTGGNVSANGGAVYVECGTFTMNGGEITECGKGSQPGHGAVMIYKSASGDGAGRFVMKSGKIYGNSSEQGAGVFVNGGIFEMSGGSISENTATGPTGSGGAVYVYNGSFDMSGNAAINNNQSSMDAGGVFVGGIGTFTVSGTPIITGNTVNGTTNNVYLSDGKTITCDSQGLTGGNIGITVGTPLNSVGNSVDITNFIVKEPASIFKSDTEGLSIGSTLDKIILKKVTYPAPSGTITPNAGDTIYIGDATIDKSDDFQTSAIDAVGASGKTVTLDISGTNEFHAGGDRPGIYVPSDGTLKITGGGTLKVYGGASWPAIGLNGGKPGVGNGTIEIAGGTIYAYAGSNAAAIGGSWGCPVAAENKINVTISGGEVFADSTSGWGWRAIGPGRAGNDDVSAAGTVTCIVEPPSGYQIRVYAGSSQYNASEIAGSPFTASTDITDRIKDSKFVHTVTEKIP